MTGSSTIFILTSCSLHTQVILILVLIDVQYLQNVVFKFKIGSNGQNHSSLDFHHPVKNFTPSKISITHWVGGFPLLLKSNLENHVVCSSHYISKIVYLVYLSVRLESLCIMLVDFY